MSAAAGKAPLFKPPSRGLRGQRIALVLGFWFIGIIVFTLRRLLEARLFSESETIRHWTELSEPARLAFWLIPVACACGAFAMQICWLPAWGRLLSWTASVILIPPALLIAWVNIDLGSHRLYDLVANRRQYVLARGGYALGESLVLFEVADAGLSWREVANLFDPDNDELTGDEHLVVSPDGRWLLFARRGLWLDCFRLAGDRAIQVEITVDLPGNQRATELDAHRRSARIAALTGLRP